MAAEAGGGGGGGVGSETGVKRVCKLLRELFYRLAFFKKKGINMLINFVLCLVDVATP